MIYKEACHWKIFIWRRVFFEGAKVRFMKGWDGHVFLQEVVYVSISDSGLLRSPQYPKVFPWTRLLGENHARVHVFLDYYTLVNNPFLHLMEYFNTFNMF
jgi:hypothetical protein